MIESWKVIKRRVKVTKVLIAGMDGYLGWPLALHLAARGHDIIGVDCFYRRTMVREVGCQSAIPIASMEERVKAARELFPGQTFAFIEGNITNYEFVKDLLHRHKPDSIVNLAQQPSPAYSMIDAKHANFTQTNNNTGLMNILWAMREETPEGHVTTLGTMGEYGFPNMPIPEGFFEVEYEDMKDILPFPRQGNSAYHVSKIQSTHNAWFACRVWELRSTDIHQGVVYGTRTEEMGNNPVVRTRFDFDECFGTMLNRAVTCAVTGHPIVPYGTGMQTRGYIALRDSIQCLTLSVENPPTDVDSFSGYRVLNQFDECYSCNQLAEIVQKVGNEKFGLGVEVKHIENPRIEAEVHYYNPYHEKLRRMGFQPTKTLKGELKSMFEDLIRHKDRILRYEHKILPKIRWRPPKRYKKIPLMVEAWQDKKIGGR